jgi:hypothetical protein
MHGSKKSLCVKRDRQYEQPDRLMVVETYPVNPMVRQTNDFMHYLNLLVTMKDRRRETFQTAGE